MEAIITTAIEWWETSVPTTWLLLLGLLISIHFLRKVFT